MGEHGMRRAFTADVPYHVPYLISNYWVRKYGWENFHPALAQPFSLALHKSRLADFAILFCVPGIDEAVGSSSTTAQQLPHCTGRWMHVPLSGGQPPTSYITHSLTP